MKGAPQTGKAKVFGIGCPRTGTTTLHKSLATLGYKHTSWNKELFREVMMNGNSDLAIQEAHKYESFDDLPWCTIYQELDKAFPGSKFILTVRKDSQTWLKSRAAHAKGNGISLLDDGSEPEQSQRARNSVRWPRDVSHYEQHNEEAISYFSNRPNSLLVVCWERGDGWQELCNFLDAPLPSLAFPHQNKTGMLLKSKVKFEQYFQKSLTA